MPTGNFIKIRTRQIIEIEISHDVWKRFQAEFNIKFGDHLAERDLRQNFGYLVHAVASKMYEQGQKDAQNNTKSDIEIVHE